MTTTLDDLKAYYAGLKHARQPFDPDYKQLAKHFLPRKSRYLDGDDETGKSSLRSDILDGTGILARRTASAGMHGGMTSPARPWFKLTLQDENLAAHRNVKPWLDETQRRMRNLFSRSNFYQAIHSFYDELITFGTDFVFAHKDPRYGIQFSALTAGEYFIDVDERGRVDTVFRKMQMSARNIVRMFGRDKCSQAVQRAFDKASSRLNMFDVVHGVFPREERDPTKLTTANMPFGSYYYEPSETTKIARISGYRYMPGFGARWDVTGPDAYGSSPTMDIIGATRMLQSLWATYLKVEHKKADPPMAGPAELRRTFLPGSYTPVSPSENPQIYALQQVKNDPQGLLFTIQDVRQFIREGLFNDLFKMLAVSATNRNITATEIAERHEEKLLQLGPVLERLHAEAFIPLIDIVFNIMLELDMVPPWPEELDEMPLKVDFISILAQAQKMVATGAVDHFCGFIGQNAAIMPELVDVVDADKAGDEYADYLGIPAKLIRPIEERQTRRRSRDEQQQLREGAEVAAQGSTAIRNLGGSQIGEQNAIEALLGGVQ